MKHQYSLVFLKKQFTTLHIQKKHIFVAKNTYVDIDFLNKQINIHNYT